MYKSGKSVEVTYISNITRFLISVYCICILTNSMTYIQAQITKQNNAELTSINQQTETDDNTSQNEQPRVEMPKKRPLLIKKYTPLHFHTIKHFLSSSVNDAIPSIQQVITEVQTFFNPIHLDIVIRVLMDEYKRGKIDLEYVVHFLESQHRYEPTILEELEPRRAFKYFNRIVRVSTDTVKAYAERILAIDPDNPDAQLHMVRYEKDETKIIQRYKQILTQHPDHPDTLSALGYTLHENSPEEALQYLRKSNRLDPTVGIFSLGLVYEKLGDFKSAWFCYNKTVLKRKRRKERFPPSRIHQDFFLDEMKLRAVERGDQWKSEIKRIPGPNGKSTQAVRTFQPIDAQQKREIEEFYQFRDWVRNIQKRKNLNQNNDFLVIEIWKHLNGGKPMFDPERIVRAYEITTQHPGNDGIQLLKKTDIEVAWEIERLMSEE